MLIRGGNGRGLSIDSGRIAKVGPIGPSGQRQLHSPISDNYIYPIACATIIGFAHALEESDKYTRGHSERVAFYSSLCAGGLSINEADTERIVQAGLMHDIGKIGIRYEKLNKPGKLTPEEVAMFRTHPAKGKRILEPIPSMVELIPGAWCHHEN